MDTIVTPVTVITLDSTRIVHSIKADLVARYFPPVVRLVQYDMSLPVIAVSFMQNGQTYSLPSGAAANIRVHKPDSTYVYNPALGCDSTRNIVYFEVSQAMAAANGDGLAIVEIVVDGDIAGSSLITLHFEDNPVPEDAIESSDEWETIYELGERIIASTVTPVSTAAGMTDHNVVYLYTGTESGWNQGHMYYYNGTTWVDAGIAVTDTTLSVAGLAADAKKTGDEITALKEDLSELDISTTKEKHFTSENTGTVYFPCMIGNGLKYTIANNSSASISVGLSVDGASDIQTIGTIVANGSVTFTATTSANNIRVWSSTAKDITVTNLDSIGYRLDIAEANVDAVQKENEELTTIVVKTYQLANQSSGTVYIPFNFVEGNNYVLKNNSAVTASFGISVTGASDAQTIGTVSSGGVAEFTSLYNAAYLRVWSSAEKSITIESLKSLENISAQNVINIDNISRNSFGFGSFNFECIRGTYLEGTYSSNLFRVCTKDRVISSVDSFLTSDEGFLFDVQYQNAEGNWLSTGFSNHAYFPKGLEAYIVIRKDPEETSTLADIDAYKRAISVDTADYQTKPLNKAFFATNQPKISMHRGYTNTAPENSLASFTGAGEVKAWSVETDIRETADGHFICMHDQTVDRTTDGSGTVSSMTLSQIQALSLADGSKVPTFEQFLGICKTYSMIPVIEIKGINNAATSVNSILNIIDEYGITGRCIITCSKIVAAVIRNFTKTIPCMVNVDTTTPEKYDTIVDELRIIGNIIIAFEHSAEYLTDAIVKKAHTNGMGVCVWVLNSANDIKAQMNAGADMVASDVIYTF